MRDGCETVGKLGDAFGVVTGPCQSKGVGVTVPGAELIGNLGSLAAGSLSGARDQNRCTDSEDAQPEFKSDLVNPDESPHFNFTVSVAIATWLKFAELQPVSHSTLQYGLNPTAVLEKSAVHLVLLSNF